MINVAILGFGIVGSGVFEVIRNGQESLAKKVGETVEVKHILDIRDFSQHECHSLFTQDFDKILEDTTVGIICETIGGIGAAYDFTKRALLAGRNVVTSNKELVATYGAELLSIAKEKNVHYLFEASVGGGIPIIRPLNHCLAANDISSIFGILNGTTNYMLTQMTKHKKDYSQALKEAQEKGYAESNPQADVEGHDTCRKIAILSSLVFGRQIDYRSISTEGISKITIEDMEYASRLGRVIKLVAYSCIKDGKVFARVSPVLLRADHPLATVEDVYNAVLVDGSATGEVMFYGKGAGKLPTASAVVADIIDIIRSADSNARLMWQPGTAEDCVDIRDTSCEFLVRVREDCKDKLAEELEAKATVTCGREDEIAIVTNQVNEGKVFDLCERYAEGVIKAIRIAQ